VWLAVAGLGAAARSGADGPPPRIATQPADFVQAGTQPSPALDNFGKAADICQTCHGGYLASDDEPWDAWVASMMAQAARDPVTRAAALLAGQDAAGAGETCIRCHAPIGWLAGRSAGGRFADLSADDLDGIACNVCHRLVDPVARAERPGTDGAILAALDATGVRPTGACRGRPSTTCVADADCGDAGPCAVDAGGGRFVVDPADTRRGPFAIGLTAHETITSPYHRRAEACAPCHDVSTPTYSRQPDGSYVLNALGAPHPTQRPHDMFPEQRTFSEWRASAFARTGVVFPDGRFGGALTARLPNPVPVATCQDCHMPDARAPGCDQAAPRPDMPTHGFAGANTWVLGAVLDEYGAASGLGAEEVARARARTERMLGAAADLELAAEGGMLRVRVVNQTGHKLPTGYPEGRRMWLGVRFFGPDGAVPLAEDGRYDPATATLDLAHTTKVYEARHVIDAGVAAVAGLPAGAAFHLALSNHVAFDNRIPPRGFTNAEFAAIGAAAVGSVYGDGQHWDDTAYELPPRATRAEVTLSYQTTTREYAEFLRDHVPGGAGTDVYARWEARGRSAPVVMAHALLELTPACGPADGPCCDQPVGTPCDDGDACAVEDACADRRCDGGLAGFGGLRCELGRLVSPGMCPDALPPTLRGTIAKRVRKARSLLEAGERARAHRPDRARRLLDRAAAALGPITARVEDAVTAGPRRRVTAECAHAVTGVVARVVVGVGRLRP